MEGEYSMRKVISKILGGTLFFCMTMPTILALASEDSSGLKLQENGYEQSELINDATTIENVDWYIGREGDVPISFEKNGDVVTYQYNENLQRTSKSINDMQIATYTYIGINVASEKTAQYEINYVYGQNEKEIYPYGFSYNGESYFYGYDGNCIRYIYNMEHAIVAEYVYGAHLDLIGVYNYDENGELITEAGNYVGDINSIRGYGMFYDKETGFYYLAGQYYIPRLATFWEVETQLDLKKSDIAVLWGQEDAMLLYYQLMNNSDHGKDIEYNYNGNGWCSALSNVEVISRLIYGECGYEGSGYYAQRKAVGWVLQNRYDYSSTRFPNNFKEIAMQTDEFKVISGPNNATAIARKGILRESGSWAECTKIAASLMCSFNASEFSAMISKPSGFSNQMFFVSLGVWNAGYNDGNSTLNGNAVQNIILNIGNVENPNVFFNFLDI